MGTCCGLNNIKIIIPETPPQIRWALGKPIGVGAYSKVYECLNPETGEIYAVKHLSMSGSSEDIRRDYEHMRREIKALSTLSHDNVIRYLQIEMTEDMTGVYLISERTSGLSVRDVLIKFSKPQENLVKIYTRQLLQGLAYLHEEGIIHRDIKCSNLLVTEDGTLKLSDFGASERVTEGESRRLRGSPYWMAPEVAKRTGHSFSADIWSVGCTVIEMVTGTPPWSNLSRDTREVLDLLSKAHRPPELPSHASEHCKDFLGMCLQIDPQMRPTARFLIGHPFCNNQRELRCNLS